MWLNIDLNLNKQEEIKNDRVILSPKYCETTCVHHVPSTADVIKSGEVKRSRSATTTDVFRTLLYF